MCDSAAVRRWLLLLVHIVRSGVCVGGGEVGSAGWTNGGERVGSREVWMAVCL